VDAINPQNEISRSQTVCGRKAESFADGSGAAKGIEAKCKIAELLGININCVNKFKERAGLLVPATEKVE